MIQLYFEKSMFYEQICFKYLAIW